MGGSVLSVSSHYLGDAIAIPRIVAGSPVSFSIKPSVASLVGPSELWAGNASLDLAVGRAVGRLSPYVGVATTASFAVERSNDVSLDPVVMPGSVAFGGVSYRWRSLLLAAEVEKGTLFSYGFRVGTRF